MRSRPGRYLLAEVHSSAWAQIFIVGEAIVSKLVDKTLTPLQENVKIAGVLEARCWNFCGEIYAMVALCSLSSALNDAHATCTRPENDATGLRPSL